MFTITVVKILFLFFPGIIATKFIEFLSGSNEKFSINKFMINSFTLGMTSYLITSPLFPDGFINSLYCDVQNVGIPEILLATLVALFLGSLFIWLQKSGYIHKFSRKLKISNELSHTSIIKTIYNSEDEDYKTLRSSWVNIRFIGNPKSIFGFVHSYGIQENGNLELLLKDVTIFQKKKDRKPLKMGAFYLKTEPSKIYIEFYDYLPSE